MKAEVARAGVLDMQVCVPGHWTDEQVKGFADGANPCGTKLGWTIRKQGSRLLAGHPERAPCDERAGCVHVTLDA